MTQSRLNAAPANTFDAIPTMDTPDGVDTPQRPYTITIAMSDQGRVSFEVKAGSAQQALGLAQKIADGKKPVLVGDTATKINRQHVVRIMAAPKFGDPKDKKTAEASMVRSAKATI